MRALDRDGIFKARPLSWKVYEAQSGAVAISIEFHILAQLNGEGGWDDWSEYDDHSVYGDFYVIRKDKSVNETGVDQLVLSLGWGGELAETQGPVPDRVVQITVKESTYDDKTRYRAEWMNPGDFVPTGGGASPEKVNKLQTQFGSLLRAAASAAASKPKVDPQSPDMRERVPAGGGDEPPPIDDESIPF